MNGVGSSPDAEDVERVEREHVDPDSADLEDVERDLKDADIEGNSLRAFADRMTTSEDVAEAGQERAGKRDIVTREDVERGLDDVDKTRSGTRDSALVDEAARDLAAPSESSLQQARGRALQNLEGNTLRSDPDLDPLAQGGEGREVAELDGTGSLGKEGGLRTGIERTGDSTGTYYAEDAGGNRYPLAEVDL